MNQPKAFTSNPEEMVQPERVATSSYDMTQPETVTQDLKIWLKKLYSRQGMRI